MKQAKGAEVPPAPLLLSSALQLKNRSDLMDKMTPQEKYDKENTQFIGLKLHKKNDSDILSAIEGKAKQTEIKRLIRLGLNVSSDIDERPSEGMTDYQFKVFLKLIRMRAETASREDFIKSIDEVINQL